MTPQIVFLLFGAAVLIIGLSLTLGSLLGGEQ
jgi:hypothetical protein